MVEELKKYAKSIYTKEDVKQAQMRFPHCPPHTHEALLYREIFENMYARRAEMISGFWMPNPSWQGCQVDDPSARVLSNYGDSGK